MCEFYMKLVMVSVSDLAGVISRSNDMSQARVIYRNWNFINLHDSKSLSL